MSTNLRLLLSTRMPLKRIKPKYFLLKRSECIRIGNLIYFIVDFLVDANLFLELREDLIQALGITLGPIIMTF